MSQSGNCQRCASLSPFLLSFVKNHSHFEAQEEKFILDLAFKHLVFICLYSFVLWIKLLEFIMTLDGIEVSTSRGGKVVSWDYVPLCFWKFHEFVIQICKILHQFAILIDSVLFCPSNYDASLYDDFSVSLNFLFGSQQLVLNMVPMIGFIFTYLVLLCKLHQLSFQISATSCNFSFHLASHLRRVVWFLER